MPYGLLSGVSGCVTCVSLRLGPSGGAGRLPWFLLLFDYSARRRSVCGVTVHFQALTPL